MCCSVSPGVDVRFSNTILYAAEVNDRQGETVHVLGYQNTAQNNVKHLNRISYPLSGLAGFWNKLRDIFSFRRVSPSAGEAGGNAMILPFPCVPRTMSRQNVLDTESCPHILKDMAKAVKPMPTARSLGFASQSYGAAPVEIFEAAGIYTVVLAQDARDIPAALGQVPEEKRPKPNPELFEAYAKWYPDWTIALCCFNNEDLKEARPLLWWYQPLNPEKLFLPAVDCHTGKVPKLEAKVMVDHTLAVGSCFAGSTKLVPNCPLCDKPLSGNLNYCSSCDEDLRPETLNLQNDYRRVSYNQENLIPKELALYLLPKVMGGIFNQVMPNGDFICHIDDVRKGIWNPVRSLPPSA